MQKKSKAGKRSKKKTSAGKRGSIRLDSSLDNRKRHLPAIIDGGDRLRVQSDSMSNHWERDGVVTPVQEDMIRSLLGTYSREPFQRQLAKFLHCAPDRDSIKAFAKRNPDKWAKAIETFANLSGYTHKLEIEANVNINNLSDVQVEQRLAELEAILQGSPRTVNAVDPEKS